MLKGESHISPDHLCAEGRVTCQSTWFHSGSLASSSSSATFASWQTKTAWTAAHKTYAHLSSDVYHSASDYLATVSPCSSVFLVNDVIFSTRWLKSFLVNVTDPSITIKCICKASKVIQRERYNIIEDNSIQLRETQKSYFMRSCYISCHNFTPILDCVYIVVERLLPQSQHCPSCSRPN